MANKKTIISVATPAKQKDKIANCLEIHRNRLTASVKDLVIGIEELGQVVEALLARKADLEEVLNKFSLADIQAAIGVNAIIQVDGTVNYSFNEVTRTVSSVDTKGIEAKLGKILPDRYLIPQKPKLDTRTMVAECLSGTGLDPMLIPYVSAHNETVLNISRRSAVRKGFSKSVAGSAVAPTLGGE